MSACLYEWWLKVFPIIYKPEFCFTNQTYDIITFDWAYHCHMRTMFIITLTIKHWKLNSIDETKSLTCYCCKYIKVAQMCQHFRFHSSQAISFDYCSSFLASCSNLFLYCISFIFLYFLYFLSHLFIFHLGMSCLSHSNSQRPLHLLRPRKNWRRWLSSEQVA